MSTSPTNYNAGDLLQKMAEREKEHKKAFTTDGLQKQCENCELEESTG